MVASKRKRKGVVSNTGILIESVYCRRCMETKKPADFFSAVDKEIDLNGFFSICKDCCNSLYDGYFRVEHDVARAILRTCRKINLKFDEASIESTMLHIKTLSDNGKETDNIIGIYKSKLVSNVKSMSDERFSKTTTDLTFSEPNIILPPSEPLDDTKESFDLKQYWGENLSFDEYQYLEKELSEWKRTHKCDTKAEEMLLKEICHKSLEIRRKRTEGNGASPANLVKELQELMKTASVDPAKTATAGAGKSQDTYSSFIKIIEENEPADYFKDKELFKDYDNIGFIFRKYVTRPLKNFITQSRDFNVEADDEEDELGFDEIEAIVEDNEDNKGV